MRNQGVFGYIIGKKHRIMHVQENGELLWQILVREIYILMKHYENKENLKSAFDKIKIAKNKPTKNDIEKCKYFANLDAVVEDITWYNLLNYCQGSFINLIESTYILNQSQEYGYIFILDFNKNATIFSHKNYHDKVTILNSATIDEIMEFEYMPTITYTEIITEMKTRYDIYSNNLTRIDEELAKLYKLKQTAKQQNSINIEDKVDILISDMEWEKKQLNINRRDFYYRVKILDLIEEEGQEGQEEK